MADFESKILPLLVGDINLEEEYTKIFINCNPDPKAAGKDTDATSPNISTVTVLFPEAAKEAEKVPMVGGSIVKLELAKAKVTVSSTDKEHSKKLGKYRVGKLGGYARGVLPGVDPSKEFPRISDLVSARVEINKSLYAMPKLSDAWHVAGVPSLVISRMVSSTIKTAKDLDREGGKKAADDIRLSGLKTVGALKYVPLQVLKNMLDVLTSSPDEEFGMANYVGISGSTFATLATYLSAEDENGVFGEVTDDRLIEILLDIFPIFHVDEDYVEGDGFMETIGYYTAYGNALYVKMPDLSGRDSSGYSSNIYSLGEETDEYVTFCFELLNVKQYALAAFDYQPAPVVELSNGDGLFPSEDSAVISVSKEGLPAGLEGSSAGWAFFLSPIITPKRPPRTPGFKESWEAVEMFTAPVLTKGYLKPQRDPAKSDPGAVIPSNDQSEKAFQSVYKDLLEYINNKDLSVFNETKLSDNKTGAEAGISSNLFIPFGLPYQFQQLGLPMSVSLSEVGANRLSDALGEANRPEVLLGWRDGKPSENATDSKFFDPKTAGARKLLASNRPNILTDLETYAQVPPLWIKLTVDQTGAEEGEYNLKVPLKGDGSWSGLDIYGDSNKLEFALYAVDDLGQIVRAPGNNVEIYPKAVVLGLIRPTGYQETSIPLAYDEPISGDRSLTFDGVLPDVVSVNFYSDPDKQNLIASIKDGDEINGNAVYFMDQTSEKLSVRTAALYSDLFGSTVGPIHVCLQMSNGVCTTSGHTINISAPGTVKLDLPYEAPVKTTIDSESQFFVNKFKGNDRAVHSVPLLMDGRSAKIPIKSKKPIFSEGNSLYAYIAILVGTEGKCNCRILEEDIGWAEGGGNIQKILSPTGAHYYVPLDFEAKLGSADFEIKNRRKAILNFPGSRGAGVNFSRFADLIGSDVKYPAYILITNAPLGDNGKSAEAETSLAPGDFGSIPMGEISKTTQSELRPFITPPYVLGVVATLPSPVGAPRVETNIPRDILDKQLKKFIKGSTSKAKGDAKDNSSGIISSDGLDRLSVVFSGAKQARMSKMYRCHLGSKGLKKFRRGRVRYAGNSNVVINYRGISGVKDEGWTDITVSKTDRYFGVTYDSTLYSHTTVTFSGSDLTGEESEPTKVSLSDEDVRVLATGEDRLISMFSSERNEFVESDGVASLSSIIFPGGSSAKILSPLPLIDVEGESFAANENITSHKAYYNFSNPIKIYPNVKLTLGADTATGADAVSGTQKGIYGVSLSDAPVDDNGQPLVEIVTIDTNGKAELTLTVADMIERANRLREEAAAALAGAKESLSQVKDAAGEASAAYMEALAAFEKTEADFNAANSVASDALGEASDAEGAAEDAAAQAAHAEALEDAASLANSGESGEGALDEFADGAQAVADGIQEVADKAKEKAEAALKAISDALALINSISDALSSIAMLANQIAEGVEQTIDSLGARPSDFTKVNVQHIYINKDAAMDDNIPNNGAVSSDDLEYKFVVKTRFEGNAAIKFNSPEIIEARVNSLTGQVYRPYGEFPFSKMIVKTGDKVYLTTIGTTKDTKFEVAGKRVKPVKGNPFTSGIRMNWIIEIPDMSSFAIFGSGDCFSISLTNSQENRMRLKRQAGNDIALNLDDKWPNSMFGGARSKQGPVDKLMANTEMFFLKFMSVKLDKANVAKEFLQSFCDMSFHLTAELTIHLKNFKVLLIPIKVIFCIIDVICALLHPIRLVFAIIRLFLCLYDLILLLPQISVPAMYLALLLHLLELLLCVIMKVLSIINAINEIITALANAIEQKNYPAVIAAEEALNEHLFSLEADLSVLEPIITILALFLELLQFVFAFPCQVGADDDPEACIDPSQLAGLILGKVAPFGKIEPDALLPLAQAYTRLPVDNIDSTGNSPPASRDNSGDMNCDGSTICTQLLGAGGEAFVARPAGGLTVVENNSTYAGNILTGLMDMATGEMKTVQEGGFFSGDTDDSGSMDNINHNKLRFATEDGPTNNKFDATFGLSFTRSTKEFNIFTGPDPRIVQFEFNGKGETSTISWWTLWLLFPLFFRKKIISEKQTLDSPPMFLKKDGVKLLVDGGTSGNYDFVSPIDGATGFVRKMGSGYQPLPLTVTMELNEPSVNPDTFDAEFTPVEVTKTFGNIPMIALVDDAFNVYFVEEDDGEGGIKIDEDGAIEQINAKMINHPSAPKKKFGTSEQSIYVKFKPESSKVEGWRTGGDDEIDGEKVIEIQANANYLSGKVGGYKALEIFPDRGFNVSGGWTYDEATESETGPDLKGKTMEWWGYNKNTGDDGPDLVKVTVNINDYPDIAGTPGGVCVDPTVSAEYAWMDNNAAMPSLYIHYEDLAPADIPFPKRKKAYDLSGGSDDEREDLGNSLEVVKVYDFPRLYIVDVRQVADDIAAACGASGPMELLLDLPGFEDDFGEAAITPVENCLKAFLDHIKGSELGPDGKPIGIIPKIRHDLGLGVVPDKVPILDVISKYEALRACVEDSVDTSCRFVVNPLNTTFKLLGDVDESPLTEYVNPEQKDLATLIGSDIIDEIEYDEMAGFPTITGAMEYASGIGDSIVAEAGSKVLIELIPRDSFDDEIPQTLDLTDSIRLDFLTDDTGTARRIPVLDTEDALTDKNEGVYTLAISADSPGKVVIRGTVCSVVIQAVTEAGIIGAGTPSVEASSTVDCIDDAEAEDAEADALLLAPGELMKVDRTLTILFVPKGSLSGAAASASDDREESGRSAKPNPQTFGTKLEN